MTSAMMTLKAKGAQDIALIVEPKTSFFHSVWLRHSNFAWEDSEIQPTIGGGGGFGNPVEFKFGRSGDLVTKAMLAIQMKELPGWTGEFSPYIWDFPRAMIDYVELLIGGYSIEKITGDMLHVWDILTKQDYASFVENMPVNHGQSIKFDKDGKILDQTTGKNMQYIYIPLNFSFTSANGLAFPMIGLSLHDVRIKVKYNSPDKIFTFFKKQVANYDTVFGSIGATVKPELDTSGLSPDVNKIRQIIRSNFIAGRVGNEMSQVIAEGGNQQWVNHVIENAFYSDKITNLSTVVTPPSGRTDGTLTIRFQIADYNLSVGAARTFKLMDSMISNADKFTFNRTVTVDNQRADWILNPPSFTSKLILRYIFLDDAERADFANGEFEFLITENQLHQHFVSEGTEQVSIDLKFNHPCKELIFFYRPDDWAGPEETAKGYYKGYWMFRNPKSAFGDGHLFTSCNLSLNSQNLYGDGRDPVYFSYITPIQFHKRVDRDHNLYVIPFGLNPGNWDPSGTINMSRLDDVKLVLRGLNRCPAGTINVYARNFNILKIKNGMGGKRYAS